jgi:hypothetical protein
VIPTDPSLAALLGVIVGWAMVAALVGAFVIRDVRHDRR